MTKLSFMCLTPFRGILHGSCMCANERMRVYAGMCGCMRMDTQPFPMCTCMYPKQTYLAGLEPHDLLRGDARVGAAYVQVLRLL